MGRLPEPTQIAAVTLRFRAIPAISAITRSSCITKVHRSRLNVDPKLMRNSCGFAPFRYVDSMHLDYEDIVHPEAVSSILRRCSRQEEPLWHVEDRL